MENAKILIANTGMDTDKIKVSFKGIYVEPAFTHVNFFLKYRIDCVLQIHLLMLSSIFQKVFGSRVRVESTAKIAELELAEKVCFLFNLKV